MPAPDRPEGSQLPASCWRRNGAARRKARKARPDVLPSEQSGMSGETRAIHSEGDDLSTSLPGNIALVGAGAFGRFCIDAYAKSGDLRVVAVADPDAEALAQVRVQDLRLDRDWRPLVEDEGVEVVHVATPPYLRGEIVLAALEAGKSVFCEKPLALSLEEAGAMADAAQQAGVALGVNYVMRHQPAYRMLEAFAASGLFGRLRSIAFENFAQHLPSDHWFWNQALSGGIFVEHGVHFFDAYGRIAGAPAATWGSAPRREMVEATVEYASGVIGRFYHEFAFPIQVERTLGTSFFERGYVEIDGWIPTRLSGAVLAPEGGVEVLRDAMEGIQFLDEGEAIRFHTDFADRSASYQSAIVSGMRDLVRKHRCPEHRMTVSVEDAITSLTVGLACQDAAIHQRSVKL